MLQVCGYNKYFQLAKTSNAKNFLNFPIIFPPIKSHLEATSLLSYSVSLKCSIWVTSDGRAFAIGDNQNFQIMGTLPKKMLDVETEIILTDKEGRPYTFLSALSGGLFSLYLVSPPDNSRTPQVIYSGSNQKPIFLNLGDRKPVSLYGYRDKLAIIDSEGAIFLITESIIKSPNSILKPLILPKDEKAIYVVCLRQSMIALSTNGQVYEASFSSDNENLTFSKVQELEGQKIDQISGYDRHCFAVSSTGQVFGKGSNSSGELALESEIKDVKKFTEISSLKKFNIVSAYAGNDYSLYQNKDGKIFGTGANYCGELFLSKNPGVYSTFSPIETVVKRGATFCITTSWISALFVGCDPPPRSPNLPVLSLDVSIQMKNENVEMKSKLRLKEIENLEMQNQLDQQLSKIKSLENRIHSKKDDQKDTEIDALKKKEAEYLLKIESLENQLKIEKLENDKKESEINRMKQNEWSIVQQNINLKQKIEEQITEKDQIIEDLRKNEAANSGEIASLKLQLQNQREENENKANIIIKLEQQNSVNLQTSIEALNENLQNDQNSKQTNDFNQPNSNSNENQNSIYKEIEYLKDQLQIQKDEIDQKSKEINDFKQKEWSQIQEIESLKKQLQIQNDQKSQQTNEFNQPNINSNENSINQSDIFKEIESLKGQLYIQKDEIDQKSKEINSFKQKEWNQKNEIESLKKQLQKEKEDNDQKFKEINDLNDQNKQFLKEIESLKLQVSKHKSKNEKKQECIEKIESITKQLSKQSNEITIKEGRIKDLEENNKKLKQMNDQLQLKLKEIEKRKTKEKPKEIEELFVRLYGQKHQDKNGKNLNDIEKFKQREIKLITEIQSLKNQIHELTDSQVSVSEKQLEIFDSETINNLNKLKSIGHGATSEVFKVSRDQIFALKVLYGNSPILEEVQSEVHGEIEIENGVDLKLMKKFLHEYEILNLINHPNIVKVFGISFGDDSHKPSILFEYCPFNLKNCIKILKNDERINILIQISEAMKFVHSLGIIHRDLKLENILLDSNKNVKISDFGLATQIGSDSISLNSAAGTFRYMAPEIIRESPDLDEKVDIYSFGVVFYLLLSKGEFPKISLAEVSNGKKAEIPISFSRFSGELISRCWAENPKERPSFDEILDLLKQNTFNII